MEPKPIVGIIDYYLLEWKNTVTGARDDLKLFDTSATVGGLDPYTEYSVRVRAATSAGQGNWSEPGIFRTASGSRLIILKFLTICLKTIDNNNLYYIP